MIWKSDRGLPLVYCGDIPTHPTLTVENYVKWYTLFVIYPDGQVESVVMVDHPGFKTSWHNHVPNPKACEVYADEMGWEWDETSLDMIYGRFAREVVEMEPYFPPGG